MFTYGMPSQSLMHLSDVSETQVYVTAWLNSSVGKSAHVAFDASEGGGKGVFAFSIPCRRDDPDLLKLQFCVRMRDECTNNKRSMEIYTTCARMNHMLAGNVDKFRARNQFSPSNYGDVHLRITNATDFRNHPQSEHDTSKPMLMLSPSKLNLLSKSNEMCDKLSKQVVATLAKNNAQSPPGGGGFLEGLTSRPFSGRFDIATGEEVYPMFKTHHAQMGPQQESIDRFLPAPVVIYHQYLKIVHSGMTMEQVLALPDAKFAQFFAEGLQFTCDAGLFPYERDFFPELAINFTDGLSVTATDTEDLGWPATESPFCGRHLRARRPIKVTESMTMERLAELFEQDPVDPRDFRMLIPDVEYTPHLTAGQLLESKVLRQSKERVLQDMYLQICTDDCETSALFAVLMKRTSVRLFDRMNHNCELNAMNDSPQGKKVDSDPRSQFLSTVCGKWVVFRNFTKRSWTLMTRYMDRGNGMLKTKQLRTMTAVGLAETASAGDAQAGRVTSYGGHCFNICAIQTPSMKHMAVGLLEGTAPLYMVPVHRSSPMVTVRMSDSGGENVMNMPQFLTSLSTTLLCMTQIINRPNGMERGGACGWPLPVPVNGWLNHTTVMCALDSDPSTKLRFYNRIMFAGWPCTEQGQGCMPVEEKTGAIVAGCHPFRLTDPDVKGVDASFDQSVFRDFLGVMEETTPPMVREDVLRELASQWTPCRPLEAVNEDARRERGVEYFRVSAMESPCAPEYLAIIFEAKRQLAREVNAINDAKPDSDGIRLYTLLEGLSVSLCADVPNRTIARLTLVESLKTALLNLKYPSKATQK